jgi:hypothetical protein
MPSYIFVATLSGASSSVAGTRAKDSIPSISDDTEKEITCSLDLKPSVQHVRRIVLSILHAVSALPDYLYGFDVKLGCKTFITPPSTNLDIGNLVHGQDPLSKFFQIRFHFEQGGDTVGPSMTFLVGNAKFYFNFSSLYISLTDKPFVQAGHTIVEARVENIRSLAERSSLGTLGNILHHNMQSDVVARRCSSLLQALWPILSAGSVSGLILHTNVNLRKHLHANIQLQLELQTRRDNEEIKKEFDASIQPCFSDWITHVNESARVPQRIAKKKCKQSCVRACLLRQLHKSILYLYAKTCAYFYRRDSKGRNDCDGSSI